MPTCQAKDFRIIIDGTQSPYTVAAEYEGQTGHGQFQHDALQPDWAETLRVLAATQTPPGDLLGSRLTCLHHHRDCHSRVVRRRK